MSPAAQRHARITEALLESGLDAADALAPIKRAANPGASEPAPPAQTPQSITDFINSLPRKKRWRLPGGGFTPEFNRTLLMLVILLLVLGVGGLVWFKHWLPWNSAGAKHRNPAASDAMRVASDAPVTSAETPAKSAAPVSDANTTGPASKSTASADPPSSSAPVDPSASKKKASRTTTLAKPSPAKPTPKPVANPQPASAKDSALVPPRLLHSVRAVASLEALHDFETGDVVIDAVVGTSGEVHFVSVLSGPPSLRASAVDSLKEYKYEPATRNGQPVPAHVTITIHFRFEP